MILEKAVNSDSGFKMFVCGNFNFFAHAASTGGYRRINFKNYLTENQNIQTFQPEWMLRMFVLFVGRFFKRKIPEKTNLLPVMGKKLLTL